MGSHIVDQLIIKNLQGAASPREKEELRSWRISSPENERRYREVAAVWRATSGTGVETDSTPPRAADIVAAANGQPKSKANRIPRRFRQVAAVAAALVLGVVLSEARPGGHGDGAPALQAAEFVTGPSELATARLSDGTVVRLAPSTRLRVGAQGDRREVWLDGKAFFAVAADERVPFTVRTRAGEALVLGTRFEVDVTSEDMQVLVVEGKVEVGGAEHRVEVEAGQLSRARSGVPPEVSAAEDVAARLDWMGPFLAFENTPLRQVAVELEARFPLRVEIADSSLETRTVTAWFGDESPEAVLRVICRITDVHCSIRDGVVSIEP